MLEILIKSLTDAILTNSPKKKVFSDQRETFNICSILKLQALAPGAKPSVKTAVLKAPPRFRSDKGGV